VIQADGGTRIASIVGGFDALRRACARLVDKGLIPVSPIREQIAAVSVGVVAGTPVVDLNYVEDSGADADMNLVYDGAGNTLEIQGTAE
jgi:ribonuclease PH